MFHSDSSHFAHAPFWFLSFCTCSIVIPFCTCSVMISLSCSCFVVIPLFLRLFCRDYSRHALDLCLKSSLFLTDCKIGMCCNIYLKVPNTIQFYENAFDSCRIYYMLTNRWPDMETWQNQQKHFCNFMYRHVKNIDLGSHQPDDVSMLPESFRLEN
jgi:flagellar biosynthesis protein FliP